VFRAYCLPSNKAIRTPRTPVSPEPISVQLAFAIRQIVLLRYSTGLTMDEMAAVLGLAEKTLDRHWRYLQAWLMKRLSM
jgi:DNA-binding NarL/FixJ family response regulator